MTVLVTAADVAEAGRRLEAGAVLRPTPLERSEQLSLVAGRPVLLKPEHRQRTGSYKIRGAYNRVSRLPPGCEVVAASAGNHAQGVALASRLTGHACVIFMPTTASIPKVEATRGYGADVRLCGANVEECVAAAREHAAAGSAVYVPPFDDPVVIAGQGTVGLEIADETANETAVGPAGTQVVPEVVAVPVGGGGLVSGVAAALAGTRPEVAVIGVEAQGAAVMQASLAAGHCVTLDTVTTMADGIANRAVSELTLAHVRAYVADVVTVSEEEISSALILLLERAKAVVEPAGAVALAAALAGRLPGTGPVVAVLSGGNVDPLLLVKLIHHGLSAAGRYMVLRVVLADRPGSLAAVVTCVAGMGLNILEVAHQRAVLPHGVHDVEVLLTVETRGHDHRREVVAALRSAGFAVDVVA